VDKLAVVNVSPLIFFSQGKLRLLKAKPLISIRINPDVLEWFKSQGVEYQTSMNAVLRMYMETQKHKS
jgi:uncharacterized protein (DUF4415 family)